MWRKATPILVITLALAGCDDGLSSDGSDRKVASAPFSFEEAVAGQTRLVVEAINGPITITGVAGAEVVTVEGTREVRAETEAEAQQGVTELQVEVEALAEEIIVETLQPEEPDPRDFVVNYEISLPLNLAVVVTAANAIVDATNIDGGLSVQLANGSLEAWVTVPPGGIIDIGIGNGDMDLFIPAQTSATFSATVANGRIEIVDLELQDLISTNRTVTGVLGEGGAEITLQSGNGHITASGF